MPHRLFLSAAVLTLAAAVGCGHNPPPVARPTPPPPASSNMGATTASASGGDAGAASTSATVPPPPPAPTVTSEPMGGSDPYSNESTDTINSHSPLQPVFFALDSDQLDDTARHTIEDDAQVLKKYATWVITIEGHCDERGTAEYNLALGERRALAVKAYLQSLGLGADRFRTVSYGKEFPFDPGHSESAWSKNRRAHLMVTSK